MTTTPMPDPLTDAGLRAIPRYNIEGRYGGNYRWTESAAGDWVRYEDVQRRAAVDQGQPAKELANLRQLADARAFSAEEARQRHTEELQQCKARAEAAEARLQALQPYLQHKDGCDLLICQCGHHQGLHDQSTGACVCCDCREIRLRGCTCGLATLTQPGAAEIKT